MSAREPMINPYEVNELTKYCLRILTYTDELRGDTALKQAYEKAKELENSIRKLKIASLMENKTLICVAGMQGAGKTTLLKILTGEYQDYEGEFSVTHGVTLGYLEQNAKLDATLDLYGEMRSTFAPVLDAMAQMQVLERKMAAQPDDTELLARHDQLQNIVDAADGYNMDVNIKKVLSGMGFAQDTWQKNIAVLSGGELTRLRLAKLLLEKPDVLILDEPTNHLDICHHGMAGKLPQKLFRCGSWWSATTATSSITCVRRSGRSPSRP